MPATREIFWNIASDIPSMRMMMYALMVGAFAIMFYGFYKRYQVWKLGAPENRMDHFALRLKNFFTYGIAQKKVLREFYPGFMHAAILWGFIIFAATTAAITVQEDLFLNIFHGSLYLLLTLLSDIFGLLVLIGIVMALYRRYVIKPERLDSAMDDLLSLLLIFVIVASGLKMEGLRIAALNIAGTPDQWAAWSPIGLAFSYLFGGFSLAFLKLFHKVTWILHMLAAFGFIAYLPYSKLSHIVTTSLNQFFATLEPYGKLSSINFEDESIEQFGVAKLEDFTWKQLFDSEACIRCGRCQDNCPAWLTQKPLSPKKLVLDIKGHMAEKAPALIALKCKQEEQSAEVAATAGAGAETVESRNLIGDVIEEDAIWACTTCRSCSEQCPAMVEHVPKIVDMRRNLVLMESSFPAEVQATFRNMENNSNPWGIGWDTRADWAKDLGVKTVAEEPNADIIFWPGCAGSFDDRNKKVSTAMVKIMQAAGVNFAILGTEEQCCGDSARRIGNEYLFQTLAQGNIEIWKNHGIKKIVTTCPHCFNTFKNEYPEFGSEVEIIHHTEFIANLLIDGKLKLSGEVKQKITYHDSCYLGRYNGIYDQPRMIMRSVPGLQVEEMKRSYEKSFCCGAGGGRMWMEENIGTRINEYRTDNALEIGVDMIATGCPFCLTMLEDGVKEKGKVEEVKTVDLAEIVAKAL